MIGVTDLAVSSRFVPWLKTWLGESKKLFLRHNLISSIILKQSDYNARPARNILQNLFEYSKTMTSLRREKNFYTIVKIK